MLAAKTFRRAAFTAGTRNLATRNRRVGRNNRKFKMSTPDLSFVCCVEAGPLEEQTIRMIESLRRFGGRFADCPVIVVKPRFGPSLLQSTRQKFQELSAEFLDASRRHKFSWFRFVNKPLGLLAAEKVCKSEMICWLDSDILILDEPNGLELGDDIDFAASCSDKEMGTTGDGSPFAALWEANCAALDIRVSDLPWVVTEREGVRIRFYWNGGMFVYRRDSNFAAGYLSATETLMESRFISSHKDYGLAINEMSAIGLAAIKQQMRWRPLDQSFNYSIGSRLAKDLYDNERARTVKILHYHDSMWPWFWDELLAHLNKYQKNVALWLQPKGPLKVEMHAHSRFLRKVLDVYRRGREAKHLKRCQIV